MVALFENLEQDQEPEQNQRQNQDLAAEGGGGYTIFGRRLRGLAEALDLEGVVTCVGGMELAPLLGG